MNFSSHQTKLVESVGIALGKESAGLIGDFKQILSTAKNLYRTEIFDFWLSEIGRHPSDLVPITIYGHQIAKSYLRMMKEADRNSVPSILAGMCENLFTYCNDNDMCFMQGDYHYYYSTVTNCLFKESEMGQFDGVESRPQKGEFRIALKTDLSVERDEYYQ